MYTSILLSALAACSFAAPFAKREDDKIPWNPADGTSATCDKESDKYMSLVVGPEDATSVLRHACSPMMPPCAYPENLPEGTICPALMTWQLDGPKSVTLNVTVESKETSNKLSGWAVNFSVTPAPQPEGSAGVFWMRGDCEGYFNQLLSKPERSGCLDEGTGPNAGTLKVGGTTLLKDTAFGISFVPRT